MEKVYITGAKRTPIGAFMGALSKVSAGDLGSAAIKGALEQSNIDAADIDEVAMGNVLPAGQGQGVARQAAIKAGIPANIPAYGVNMVCGSGLKAVMQAFLSIKAGESQVVVAGGTESMSQAPYLIPAKTRDGIKMGNFEVKDHLLEDGLTDVFNDYHMGCTAENIVRKYGISREVQDLFAHQSQQKAIQSVDAGAFKAEIVPVETKVKRETVIVDTDEYPNRKSNLEKLSTLRPAFEKEGSVTAGNASGINDGASATVVVSESYAKKHQLTPLVEILAIGQSGVDPALMGLGPTPAIQKALKKANVSLADIDVIELNEAFASQSLGVIHELAERFELSEESIQAKTNLNGGAIALGHPLGASGNRILVTLIYLLKKRKQRYGLASLCIGGGMGVAVVIENTDYQK
ncbi:acetyl-CoA acetyltransferase [Pisciglobus halotolerans]|uniref:acetyl-CoA C-acetyltransferase n=2 Tax=Pisciglobus halotolerans TaxID=745365 RepID=A0A1I3DNW1_9LACT|nr:acetyl-CoA C-acetyltransferase [Pisciglobus halotolerans]SFH88422.1 acetyl-CoA acetyltransferase [Pisciglobus halotolerans]